MLINSTVALIIVLATLFPHLLTALQLRKRQKITTFALSYRRKLQGFLHFVM